MRVLSNSEETDPTLKGHPCFDARARHNVARIHLPVAPTCNVQCNFCDRRFDCVSESRPGVTSQLLRPHEALQRLHAVMKQRNDLGVVGIAGPGDPMATPDLTLTTFRLIREAYPETTLCLSTNGLNLIDHVDALAELSLGHVTVTVNAVDPEIGARIYGWIRGPDGRRASGKEAASWLIDRQRMGIERAAHLGLLVKVNTVVVPGVNDAHVEAIARDVSQRGAKLMNCMAMLPVEGTPFGVLEEPPKTEMQGLRRSAAKHVRQMSHCARCRSDATGLLGEEGERAMETTKPYVAAASREGVFVNQHLGEAEVLLIYAVEESAFKLMDVRRTPQPGGGIQRWVDLAEVIADCRALLVGGVGTAPKKVLENREIAVLEMEGMLEEGLEAAFEGRALPSHLQPKLRGCGLSCGGDRGGCAA
ncbi:MAG: radical SAM protein [Deltaproteobacteria bacterium]|nr:radical SAM protein [Deltaproteobacteria bacterium]